MNRKVFLITIYYIIGTIGGLYFNNIILFLIAFFNIHYLIFRKNKKKLVILALVCIIAFFKSYCLVMYTKSMQCVDNVELVGDIEHITTRNNTQIVLISVNKIDSKKVLFKTKVRAYIKNNKKLDVGDKVYLRGIKRELVYTKNEGVFDYKRYLHSKEIHLSIDVEKVKLEKRTLNNYFLSFINKIRDNIKSSFYKYLPDKNAALATALVIGDKEDFDEEVSSKFSEAGLSHIIAISGMHTVYVAYIAILFKRFIGKRKSYVLVIIVLFMFCNITSNTESVYRASIMLSLFYISKIIYRKSDSLSNLFVSVILGLIKNPFCIFSPGFILSTAGTFGILTVYEHSKESNSRVKEYIKNQIKLGISANIILFPIVAKMYNKISLIFMISSPFINSLMTILMPSVFVYGILGMLNFIVPVWVLKIAGGVTKILTDCLLMFADIFSRISIFNIQVVTPSILTIITYYIIVFIIYRYKREKKSKNRAIYKRIIRYIFVGYLSILLVMNIIVQSDNSLYIYFVDVGQGDCTLIRTPQNHIVLIDGGGSEDGKEDNIGEKILIPFLLNKHIKKVDYIIVSHFDSDHVGGLLTVMERLKVENVIISKQGEDSENYRRFRHIVNKKKINVIVVEKDQIINIEKNLNFDILWPEKNLINENILNNNSVVCKLNYSGFSMLFTGDVEALAEEKIVKLYEKNDRLNSTCLKAGHHGSKTSSTTDFLDLVNPKYVLIGVGINNKFGHPNEEVIERYKNRKAQIYRTDLHGEIIMNIKSNGKIIIKKQDK